MYHCGSLRVQWGTRKKDKEGWAKGRKAWARIQRGFAWLEISLKGCVASLICISHYTDPCSPFLHHLLWAFREKIHRAENDKSNEKTLEASELSVSWVNLKEGLIRSWLSFYERKHWVLFDTLWEKERITKVSPSMDHEGKWQIHLLIPTTKLEIQRRWG